jgi:mRNA-degrading endonuclease toxin of MazEF toxin-antitoxin module
MGPRRGDLYFINVPQESVPDGQECYEHMYVVVSNDDINAEGKMVSVVPLTSPINKDGKPKNVGIYRNARVRIPANQKVWESDAPHRQSGDSLAKTEQVCPMAQSELIRLKKCGHLTEIAMNSLESGLCDVLNIPNVGRAAASLAAPGKPIRPPVAFPKRSK